MLSHPGDLVSLCTQKVKVLNMSQCFNLRTLWSQEVAYEMADIVALKNLRRLYSKCDSYSQSDGCLLRDLFRTTKLEYVKVWSCRYGSNVMGSIPISRNIENLRCIYLWHT